MRAIFCFKAALCTFFKNSIVILNNKTFKVTISSIKVFDFLSNSILAKFFL